MNIEQIKIKYNSIIQWFPNFLIAYHLWVPYCQHVAYLPRVQYLAEALSTLCQTGIGFEHSWVSHVWALPRQQWGHTLSVNFSSKIQVQAHSARWESTHQMSIDVKWNKRSCGVAFVAVHSRERIECNASGKTHSHCAMSSFRDLIASLIAVQIMPL